MNEKIFKIIKFFVIGLVLIIVAILGYMVGGGIKYYLDIRKSDKAVERFQGSLEDPYKNDTYGGKTPEETWGMFLDALKKGDIDSASKYFAVNKQKDILERLQESIKLKRLDSAIEKFSKELIKEKDFILGEKAYYYIPIKNSAGEVEAYSIVFYLNPYTKTWKIVSL